MNDQTRKFSFEVVRWLIAFIIGAGGWIYAVAGKSEQVNQNTQRVADHETRLRTVERSTTNVERDVAWIRQAMEREGRP